MQKSDSFYYDGHSKDPHGHLWFAISDPDKSGCLLIVNVTSLVNRKIQDLSCILDNTDHPNIKYPSIVAYRHADLYSNDPFDAPQISTVEPLSPATLLKIQNGAKNSKFLKKKYYEYFSLF